MADLLITIARTDPKFHAKLKKADSAGNRNGKIDTKEEITEAANQLCEIKPSSHSEAESCLKVALGIETNNTLISWEPSLFHPLNSHDGSTWEMANWANGGPFDCGWRPKNVSFSGGFMRLTLNNTGCPQECHEKPYASGEYRTRRESFGYGYYEVRMKAAKGRGLVAGTFFTYRGVYGERSHDEIDFEFLGKNPRMVQLNYYAEGRGTHDEHKKDLFLNFDASEEFHNYGFKLTRNSLTWYIDGRVVHTAAAAPGDKLPNRPMKIMLNFWPGTSSQIGWLGQFTFPGKPMSVEYDWIKFSPLREDEQKAPLPAKKPKTPVKAEAPIEAKPAAPTGPLSVDSISQGSFAFNNGKLTVKDKVYYFKAEAAKDPGFGIDTGNKDISGYKTLKFDIGGSFKRLGGYARVIAQVYTEEDNDYTPSISLDPIEVKSNLSTVSIDLENKIPKAKKIQFLLVTDKGNCQLEIRNLRFE